MSPSCFQGALPALVIACLLGGDVPQRPDLAKLHALRVAFTEVALEDFPVLRVEADGSERAGLETVSTADASLGVNEPRACLLVFLNGPHRAGCSTGGFGALAADDRDVEALGRPLHDVDPGKGGIANLVVA